MRFRHIKYHQESYKAGASASLNKSLNEIWKILEGIQLPPDRPKRERLREEIRHALILNGRKFYKIGFRRGVSTFYEQFKENGKIVFPIEKRMTVSFLRNEPPEKVSLRTLHLDKKRRKNHN